MESKATPKHNHIDLPHGFYAMLCHGSGMPGAEWDRMARLLAAVWEMREALRAIINNHCTNEKLFCSTCTPARALLARIDEDPT